MSNLPSFDDIFAVISAASAAHATARVVVPAESRLDHEPTRLAVALNALLDAFSARLTALEREAARQRALAEVATRELEAFSYSIAHDLRAPLRGMNGFAHVLLDSYRDKLDAEGQDCLQEIVFNASKMGDLIDGSLSLAGVTRSELHRETVDLSSVVRATARRLSTAEPERQLELEVEDHLIAVLDPVLAQALVENLVGNAWKFTKNVPIARIAFGATTKNGTSAFFVRDNGAGFDMAFAGKLFAPFQRLHTTAEFPGSGIGLATVRRIVHRHGGRVWAEGAVDAGATVYFTLPDRGSEEIA
jgi:light-regulated signal transduction histidine kinase (bacteriophytochrome)